VDADELEARILAFLRQDLAIRETVERDTGLVSTGLLDSADLVRLATQLERMLGFTIPDHDISADNFDSIEVILGYVERRLGS
jgi:acyl carrier protein